MHYVFKEEKYEENISTGDGIEERQISISSFIFIQKEKPRQQCCYHQNHIITNQKIATSTGKKEKKEEKK